MKAAPTTGIRLTATDRKLISALQKKLGVALADVFRMGLRLLAAKEGISA